MCVVITGILTQDQEVALFKTWRKYDNKPAYMMGVFENLENITHPDIVGVYRVPSGVPYDSAAVVVPELQVGEDSLDAAERLGKAFADAMETYTKPYKNDHVVEE